MAVELTMPQMGLTMTQGTIIKWMKQEGDLIVKDEPIVEIMTDKASFEVEAPEDGILLKITYPEGEAVPIATIIAYIGQAGEVIEAGQASGSGTTVLPETKESAQEGRKFISPRARLAAGQQGLTEMELSYIEGSGPQGRVVESDVLAFAKQSKIRATPLARKVAGEYSVDLADIKGSELGGKVTRQDVLGQVQQGKVHELAEAPSINNDSAALKIIPVEGIRKIIAERMSYSARTIPHVTLTTEVDMTEMLAVRKQVNNTTTNGKISVTDIILKVSALALEKHPEVNATLEDKVIKLLKDVNIGVAVATSKGLMVPVVKKASRKSLSKISQETKDLIQRTRDSKLKPDEMTGGTFTVTNLGMYDIDGFTPIINSPECAILGVGRMVQKPVVYSGEITIRTMMVLSLSFDHRIVDGAPAAVCLQTIKRVLENPLQLIMGV